jgi:prepilin-type N-terminal cleavage/methylation domain-containing protein
MYIAMRCEKGFTLVEVLIALVIFSITVVAFTFALQTTTHARALVQIRTTAMSLASSAIETVKAEPYVTAPSGGVATYSVASAPSNYSIATLDRTNAQVDGVVYGIPWNVVTNTPLTGGDGKIQKITVIVKYAGNEVVRLKDYTVSVQQ